jgi:hypothetical protein
MRRSYVVPMRWMVIYEYEISGGTLNLSFTNLPKPWSPWEPSPLRKNSHGSTGIRTWDLMISSQKLWALYHEACHTKKYYVIRFKKLRKTNKIPRTSGQHYKVYTPRFKNKLFFSPSPQTYSLLSGVYVVHGVLLVLQLLPIARILKGVLKKCS